MSSIHAIYRDEEIIVALNGVPYTVDVDDPRYYDVHDAIINDDIEALDQLLSVTGKSKRAFDELEEFGIKYNPCNEEYTYLGNPLPLDLTDYMLSALDQGTVRPVIQFISRLFENPNHDTRSRLFKFMQVNKLPLDSSGRFLAFKVVTSDYLDKHTGSVDNTPGVAVPRMSWAQVDTDPSVTCSRGYHACSREYIPAFYSDGDRVVSVAIAPEDVGSIPDDYNNSKLRCRQYVVLADITDQYRRELQDVRIHNYGGIDPSPVRQSSPWTRDYY